MSTRAQEKFVRQLQARIKRGVTSGRTVTPKRTEMLSGQYESAKAAYTSCGNIMSTYLFITRLIGFWAMNVTDANVVLDNGPLQKHLTANGTPGVGLPATGYTPLVSFDGSNQYLYRDDSDFNGTSYPWGWGCWVKFDTLAAVNFIGKFGASGNYGWTIYNTVGNAFAVSVSSDGTALTTKAATTANATGTWYFVAALYEPSTFLKLFVNGVWYENTTSIPASIYATTAQFQLGGNSAQGQYMDGQISLAWVAFGARQFYIQHLFDTSRALFGV